MRAAGRGAKHEAAITSEIAQRVRQLKMVDAKIKQREAEGGL